MSTRKSRKNSPKMSKKSLFVLPFRPLYFYKNIPCFFRQLKWAIIRGVYGWSPYDVWDMDCYLLKILPEMLTYFAYHHYGYPFAMTQDGDKKDEGAERWTQKLLEMAEYFRQADESNLKDLEKEVLDDKMTYKEFEKHMGDNLHKGMEELEKYFYNLWD